MIIALILSILLNICLGWLAWEFYSRYMNELNIQGLEYPPYYQTVLISYRLPNQKVKFEEAWLAVNDNNELIWTLSDNTTVISDEHVLNWILL